MIERTNEIQRICEEKLKRKITSDEALILGLSYTLGRADTNLGALNETVELLKQIKEKVDKIDLFNPQSALDNIELKLQMSNLLTVIINKLECE